MKTQEHAVESMPMTTIPVVSKIDAHRILASRLEQSLRTGFVGVRKTVLNWALSRYGPAHEALPGCAPDDVEVGSLDQGI